MTFPRIDPTLQEHMPLLGAVTNAIAHSAVKWGSARHRKSYLHPQDGAVIEVRRLCLERRLEKDRVKRKTLSVALHIARQNMRRKQAVLRCKEATHLEAPSRLKGQSPQTRAPFLERVDETGRTEKVEHLQGLTDIVYEHFEELFKDPSHAAVLEWIWQRWPWVTLHSLLTIDCERERTGECLDVQRT